MYLFIHLCMSLLIYIYEFYYCYLWSISDVGQGKRASGWREPQIQQLALWRSGLVVWFFGKRLFPVSPRQKLGATLQTNPNIWKRPSLVEEAQPQIVPSKAVLSTQQTVLLFCSPGGSLWVDYTLHSAWALVLAPAHQRAPPSSRHPKLHHAPPEVVDGLHVGRNKSYPQGTSLRRRLQGTSPPEVDAPPRPPPQWETMVRTPK